MPQGDVIVGGSISANSTSQTAPAPNSTANFNASGVSGGSMQVTGTFVGTLVPEGSLTGAPGDWQAAPIANLAGTAVTSITAPGFFTFNAETFVFFRLRATAWTSGTAAVVFKASPGSGPSAGGGGGGGGGAVTVADGADVAQGTTTDAGIITDAPGTAIGFLRGQIIQWAAALTRWGSLTETAPATDTASSGLNGRLQRLAQRMTSLIALLPAALVGGRLDVNIGATGVTQPVSGTVTANQGTQGAAGTASWPVQGAAAAGAAIAGNPVQVGGTDGTNAQALKVDTSGRPMVAGAVAAGSAGLSSVNPVYIGVRSSDNTTAVALTGVGGSGDGLGSGLNQLITIAEGFAYNGATYDRVRNNVDATLLASGARTTTQTGSNITAYNCQAIAVTLDVTAITATCSLTVTINYTDPASGKSITLLSSAVIAAVSTTMLVVDPRPAAAANLVAQKPIGRTFTITVTVGNANSQTYSLGYTLIPC